MFEFLAKNDRRTPILDMPPEDEFPTKEQWRLFHVINTELEKQRLAAQEALKIRFQAWLDVGGWYIGEIFIDSSSWRLWVPSLGVTKEHMDQALQWDRAPKRDKTALGTRRLKGPFPTKAKAEAWLREYVRGPRPYDKNGKALTK